jgi:fibronectin type 3 domain-containing protein
VATAAGTAPDGNGTPAAIDLSWQPVMEADMAGFIVYRREGSSEWQRISPVEPVIGPAFHDAHVEPGHTYIYAVSAIDKSGHESARSAEAQETVPGP